jgi:hypothetical protein
MARVRRSAAERAALIDQWRDSRLSLLAFCSRRGLNAKTMSGWVYKAAQRAAIDEARREVPPAVGARVHRDTSAPGPAFLPVRVADAAARNRVSGRSGVVIVLGPGRRVVIAPGFDPETLRRVVAVLEGRPC